MSRLTLLAAILAAFTLGCGDNHEHGDHNDSEGTGSETTKIAEPTAETDTPSVADEDEDEGIETSISMLDEEDQKLARAQKTCPVSDQPLGSMGTPIKLEVKGKTVFLCCAGCKKRILRDPDKYLAKLK